MKFTVAEVAGLLGGKVEGDEMAEVSRLAKIEQGEPGAISFLSNPKYAMYLYDTLSTAVIINEDFIPERAVKATLIRVPDAYTAFSKLLEMAESIRHLRTGIEEKAFVHADSTIGEEVYIGSFSYISSGVKLGNKVKVYPNVFLGEGVTVGAGSILMPGVVVQPFCKIGENCILHPGVVIGSDGFGFAPQKDGRLQKIPQTGIVVLEDGVEIGANTCIDRATLGETIIRSGAKIDNLVQIAHNTEIGNHTAIASQTGISGSTKIGKYCMVGGQVGFVGHVTIADKTQIGGQSGVSKSVETEGTILRGSPAQPIREQLKTEVLIKQLATLFDQVRELEKKIAILESRSH